MRLRLFGCFVALAMMVPMAEAMERPWTTEALPGGVKGVAVTAADRYRFWVATMKSILATTDGGYTWDTVLVATGTSSFTAINYHPLTGVTAVGEGGVVAGVTSTGQVYETTIDAELSLRGVATTISGRVIVVGSDANNLPAIFSSESLDDPWQIYEIDLGGGVAFSGVRIVNGHPVAYGTVLAGEGSGHPFILLSENEGNSWRTLMTDESREFAISAVTNVSMQLIAVGYHLEDVSNGGLYRSTDGGETWQFEEHQDMALVSDVVRGQRLEVIAVGMRFVELGGEPFGLISEFSSTDAGRTWSVQDLPSADGGPIRLARGEDRLMAVGYNEFVHQRWYDPAPNERSVVSLRRLLDLGRLQPNELGTQTFSSVARSNSGAVRTVKRVYAPVVLGLSVEHPRVGTLLSPGEELEVRISYEPVGEGTVWDVLSVEFDDGSFLDFYVSAVSLADESNGKLEQPTSGIGFGVVNGTHPQMNRAVLARNASAEPITVTEVEIVGEDRIAFIVEPELPLPAILQPGQELMGDVYFMPYDKGIYRTECEVRTSVGKLLIPVAAESRIDVLTDVVDFGEVPIGEQKVVESRFRHGTANIELQVESIQQLSVVFAVNGVEPQLPWSGAPSDVFTVLFQAAPLSEGLAALVHTVVWSDAVLGDVRHDRRILRVHGRAGSTSVDELPSEQLSFYPNPSSQSVTVNLPDGHMWRSLSILDATGSSQLTIPLNGDASAVKADVGSLAPGLYIVQATAEDAIVRQSMVKAGN